MNAVRRMFLTSAIAPCKVPFVEGDLTRRLSVFTLNSHKTFNRWKSTTTDAPSKEKDDDEDLDKPIKFTTSKAAQWKAVHSFGGGDKSNMPDSQPIIVVVSVAIFLLYFLVLREESDIDEEMKQPLWERVPGLEKKSLTTLLKYNEEHGIPTAEIERRLKLIEKQEENLRKQSIIK